MSTGYDRFRKLFENKTDNQLQEIVNNQEYTEDARKAAKDILWEVWGVQAEIIGPSRPSYQENIPEPKKGTRTGEIIKIVAWIQLGIMALLTLLVLVSYNFITTLCVGVSCTMTFLLIYAFGEICCLLADIKENTKYLRDYRPGE